MTRSSSLQRAAATLAALGLALAAFLAVSTLGTTAQASPSSGVQAQQSRSVLFLSVTTQDGDVYAAILLCDPPGGLRHYDPRGACADIAAAGGDFTKLPGSGSGRACPDVYEPVVATAFGWWEDHLLWFSHAYGNMCEMSIATDPVFPVTGDVSPMPTTSTIPGPTVTLTIPPPPTRCPTTTVTWRPPHPTGTVVPPESTVTSPPSTGEPPETTFPDGTTIPDTTAPDCP